MLQVNGKFLYRVVCYRCERSSGHKSDGGGRKLLPYVASEHKHGLMPLPIHIGKYMWQKRSHFQLPFDLWWMRKHCTVSERRLVWNWNIFFMAPRFGYIARDSLT